MTREKFLSKAKTRFSFSNLNTQVFFFVVVPVSLLFLTITFGSIQLHQQAMRDLVGERDLRTVRSTTNAIREQLNHLASAIQQVAVRLDEGSDPTEILDSVSFLMDDFDAGMGIFSADGELYSFILGELPQELVVEKISQMLPAIVDQGDAEPVFAEPFQFEDKGEYFSFVFFWGADQKQVVVGVFSISRLARQTLADITPYDNKRLILLIGQNGEVLYQNGILHLSEDIAQHPGVIGALKGESGTTYIDTKNSEIVVAFSPIAPVNWALVIEESWNEVASPLLRYSETGSLVLVPVVIFAMFALWFGTRSIIQPLAGLQDQARAFTEGDHEAFKDPVGGINEIQTLQSAFKDMAEKVLRTQQALKNYLGLITNSQEEERKRLARELHDETLQSLIALNQHVMMSKRMAKDAGVQDALDEIENMVSQTMTELRRLTRALRPIYLEDLGLVAALEMLTIETSSIADIPIKFTTSGDERRLTDATEIAIFRITQEALNNIMRHSEATSAGVSLRYGDKDVLLTISDDGKGFGPPESPTQLSNQEHFGLIGIFERAELIGAKVHISSEIDQGTQLVLQIPL